MEHIFGAAGHHGAAAKQRVRRTTLVTPPQDTYKPASGLLRRSHAPAAPRPRRAVQHTKNRTQVTWVCAHRRREPRRPTADRSRRHRRKRKKTGRGRESEAQRTAQLPRCFSKPSIYVVSSSVAATGRDHVCTTVLRFDAESGAEHGMRWIHYHQRRKATRARKRHRAQHRVHVHMLEKNPASISSVQCGCTSPIHSDRTSAIARAWACTIPWVGLGLLQPCGVKGVVHHAKRTQSLKLRQEMARTARRVEVTGPRKESKL